MRELMIKENKVRLYMQNNNIDGVLLFRRDTFSWFTGGKVSHIIRSIEYGMVVLFITSYEKYCISNQVEKNRIAQEELYGMGYKFLDIDWWNENYQECIKKNFGNIRLASDRNLDNVLNIYEALKKMRFSLEPEEVKRLKELSAVCTDIVEETCATMMPGFTENEVCGALIGKAMSRGIEAPVALVAADERIFKYRHPLNTEKKIEKYAIVVLCGMKYGLVANLTRSVYFGTPPDEIITKYQKVQKIEAEILINTRPGMQICDIFKIIKKAYEEEKYRDEWQLLHQGGAAGYDTREYLATPSSKQIVQINQAFTWNPSISGAKSEDTILVKEDGFEILTQSDTWPTNTVKASTGLNIKRPAILLR